MTDEAKPAATPPGPEAAKKRLEALVFDLGQLVPKTDLILPVANVNHQLMIKQIDILVTMLAEKGNLDMTDYFTRVGDAVEQWTAEVRRAILGSGGASILANLKPKGN